jgi:hypothetical protein
MNHLSKLEKSDCQRRRKPGGASDALRLIAAVNLSELKPGDKRILIHLLSFRHNCTTGLCFMKEADLAADLTIGVKHLRERLAKLERLGWLTCDRQHFKFVWKRGIGPERTKAIEDPVCAEAEMPEAEVEPAPVTEDASSELEQRGEKKNHAEEWFAECRRVERETTVNVARYTSLPVGRFVSKFFEGLEVIDVEEARKFERIASGAYAHWLDEDEHWEQARRITEACGIYDSRTQRDFFSGAYGHELAALDPLP